jgi:hypothetical protein
MTIPPIHRIPAAAGIREIRTAAAIPMAVGVPVVIDLEEVGQVAPCLTTSRATNASAAR